MSPLAFFNSPQDLIIILVALGFPCLVVVSIVFLVVKLNARKPQ